MEAMTYEDYKLALQGASSEEREELMFQACADPGITWDDFVDLFGISELVNSPTYQKCWGG